jgi:uncharacterized BrkB/YihY/UPF0761 family membrane protein
MFKNKETYIKTKVFLITWLTVTIICFLVNVSIFVLFSLFQDNPITYIVLFDFSKLVLSWLIWIPLFGTFYLLFSNNKKMFNEMIALEINKKGKE